MQSVKIHISRILLLGLFGLSACLAPRKAPATFETKTVNSTIPVSDVWSGHPVGFDMLTADRFQYVVYYDQDRNMSVAQRRLNSKEWKVEILPSTLGWDSHNSVVIAEDKKGYLHISGNMHNVPLVYFRSRKPHDIGDFEALDMVGREEQRVTYPVFFKDKDGELFFQYRDGGSGNGVTYINRYNTSSESWTRVLDQGLFDGEEETNAYPTSPKLGPDGFFHYMWVWRLNPIANTNHNLSYVRTQDFQHFENIQGEDIPIPIQYRERRVIADPVGPWNGLMNSSKRLSFDSKGRVLLGYHKFDPQGRSQLFIGRYEEGLWHTSQVSDWPDFTWAINKRGSLGHDIGLYEIKADGKGHIYLSYSHVRYGSGLLKVDENTMELVEDLKGKTFIEYSGLREQEYSDMLLHRKLDDGGRYLLQWETLPSNYDRPREPPYPEATRLVLYELDN